jgi:hypothetical protein
MPVKVAVAAPKSPAWAKGPMVAKYVCCVIGVFGALYRMTSADWAECIVIGNILFFGLLYVATDDGQPTMRTVKKFEEELRGYETSMDWKAIIKRCDAMLLKYSWLARKIESSKEGLLSRTMVLVLAKAHRWSAHAFLKTHNPEEARQRLTKAVRPLPRPLAP